MHERPPPENVILCEESVNLLVYYWAGTHIPEYIPGYFASFSASLPNTPLFHSSPPLSPTSSGWACSTFGDSHLSGFHSHASRPHTVSSRLAAAMPTTSPWFFATGIEWIVLPSVPTMGRSRGSVVGLRALFATVRGDKIHLETRLTLAKSRIQVHEV